ncbi:hypothetical protein ABZ543_13355 [Streptomyces roseifaciens]
MAEEDWLHSAREWEDALAAAESNEFCEIDSAEEGGWLAGWVSQQYTHDKIGQDADRLHAVIKALVEGAEETEFSSRRFTAVMESINGDLEADDEKLVQDYLDEHFDGFPLAHIKDIQAFARDYVYRPGEFYAESHDGSTLYVFDTTGWWPSRGGAVGEDATETRT